MKFLVKFTKSASLVELAVFMAIACLALTAGYASLAGAGSYTDITGSTRPVKAAPVTTMQPMPPEIETTAH